MRGAAAIAVLLLLAPAVVSGQPTAAPVEAISFTHTPTEAMWYGHLLYPSMDFPINPQVPDASFIGEPSQGVVGTTTTCVGPAPATGLLSADRHTWHGIALPSRVAYEQVENDAPAIYWTPGMAFDMHLDAAAPFTVHWYLTADQGTPGVAPQVVVRATMQAGNEWQLGDGGLDAGEAIAQGQSEPADLSPLLSGHPHVAHEEVDGRDVYHFAVPMEFQRDVVRADEGFNLRVEAFVENPVCRDPGPDRGKAMAAVVPFAGEERWPRMELTVQDPWHLDGVRTETVNGTSRVHLDVSTPWGNADLDPSSIEATVTGPAGMTETVPASVVQPWMRHPHGTDPANITVAWSAADMGPGPWDVVVTGCDLQGVSCFRLVLRMDAASGEEVPSFALPWLLASLAACVLLARRR